MNTANPLAPSKSPVVFVTHSADSAKAEAHCAMDSSDAPAHTISTTKSQNIFVFNSCPMVILLPSLTIGSMGQTAKLVMLYSGITAHKQDNMRQFSVPNIVKKTVDRRIVPTAPQQ